MASARTARASGQRMRNGESGAGPIIIGLIAIIIFFQIEQPIFLHASNLGNLFPEASIYVMFGLAEMFALVLSEIDLSVGFAGAVGAFIFAALNAAAGQLVVGAGAPGRAVRDDKLRRDSGHR